jgi:SAM-dependent methyltransferase
MSVFNEYSSYYNLLYCDKDYDGEVKYMRFLIDKYKPGAKKILDFGCGTGQHARRLKTCGFSVHGVDQSDDMLEVANEHAEDGRLSFTCSDIRSVNLSEHFDVVLSLFHVMSYLTKNDDLAAAFKSAFDHLKPAGVFIFDCWYGPAVLTDRPVVRVKRLEDDDIEVVRIAEPVLHANANVVDVNYHVIIRDKATGNVRELQETHPMRYLFKPEIELMLEVAGFKLEDCFEYMTENEPGYDTWNACFIGRKP